MNPKMKYKVGDRVQWTGLISNMIYTGMIIQAEFNTTYAEYVYHIKEDVTHDTLILAEYGIDGKVAEGESKFDYIDAWDRAMGGI